MFLFRNALGHRFRILNNTKNKDVVVVIKEDKKPKRRFFGIDTLIGLASLFTAIATMWIAHNDQSQNDQIKLLTMAIDSIHEQNKISNQQLGELITISTQTRNLDSITNDEIIRNLKEENSTKESDLFQLQYIYSQVLSIGNQALGSNFNLATSFDVGRNWEINNLVDKLSIGLNNKIFQTDKVIKYEWYKFFTMLKVTTLKLQSYSQKSFLDGGREKYISNMQNKLKKEYKIFTDTVSSRLNILDESFRKINMKDFINIEPEFWK